ncbi:Glyoxalase/bleomycin resistance protein/dioxygenase [Pseudopedobacter saltans DSM 12145]|uniref:Glyoxalase/bleomycin resistance protein/dioxygenase n=1 Tax=Pseudopedobacter saltans (strain ATCC 51119 / DSM 12145 / JCM 21818 / CCUG 39354 / LMG 10337 / NBRC 100064 / NCIMB 13643) TaxID=762903 RepID=F0S8Q5_PSESL|nr:VOC family protein [Pseudopedobacter saltans]ADY52386.1 Glyoxalase/bleomycin resistance protein/dioxygenase [Pseudopedobacter saltans DSM 12145]
MNIIGYFEIQSSESQREVRFYNNVFGWIFTRDHNIPIEYYRISTGSIHGGLLKRATPTPPLSSETNAFTCSIQVENFDQTAKLIIHNGGKVAMPKFAIAKKCFQGYFTDQDNNIFGIFEVDENA